MTSKVEIAERASYTVSSAGWAAGVWFSEHWLQLISAVVILATYFTQLIFTMRRDRRERIRHDIEVANGERNEQ